jgi:hypothetical protein
VNIEGQPVGNIEIVADRPGLPVEYEVIELAPESRSVPGRGAVGGPPAFDGGALLARTLVLNASDARDESVVTVNMSFSAAEITAADTTPMDLQLQVLDASRDGGPLWVPAGRNLGEAQPTGVVGESGFVRHDDGAVDFWAVRERGGTFAVGKVPSADDRGAGARLCGVAMLQPLLVCGSVLWFARRRSLRE